MYLIVVNIGNTVRHTTEYSSSEICCFHSVSTLRQPCSVSQISKDLSICCFLVIVLPLT